MNEGNAQKRRMKSAASAALLAGLGSVILGIALWKFGSELGRPRAASCFFSQC